MFEVADRIVVLHVGRRVATFEQRETTPQEVVAAIVGFDVQADAAREATPAAT